MCKMFSYLLVTGLIFAEISVSHPHTEVDNVCSKSGKTFKNSDCVVASKCTILDKLARDGRVIHCGKDTDTGTAKVCCPAYSQRFIRELEAQTKKNSYDIAQRKCNEYSSARYVVRTIPSKIPNKSAITVRKLECAAAQPLIVVGGIQARLKEYPHMAVIGFSNRPDKPVNDSLWACGGSLISHRYVLTAAHCDRFGEYEATWVRLGELILHNDGDAAQPKDFRILERIPHPKYNESSVYFDIMLLKLSERVKFTPHMRPICLYSPSVLAPALKNRAFITGWGAPATGEQQNDHLTKAQISFTDDEECIAAYKDDKKLANGFDPALMVCAINKQYGNDTCQGDSGGPLQVPIPEWTCMFWQVGITSYGATICGQKNISTIYTKVSTFIPWIQSIVWP